MSGISWYVKVGLVFRMYRTKFWPQNPQQKLFSAEAMVMLLCCGLSPYYIYQIYSLWAKCMKARLLSCPKIDCSLSIFSTFLTKSQEAFIPKWTVANWVLRNFSAASNRTRSSSPPTGYRMRRCSRRNTVKCGDVTLTTPRSKSLSEKPKKSTVINDTGHPSFANKEEERQSFSRWARVSYRCNHPNSNSCLQCLML